MPVLEAESPPVISAPTAPNPMPLLDRAGQPVVVGYEILRDLERSPTGVRRYEARQQVTRRKVLLEVVLACEDPTQRAWSSLRAEAGLLAQLPHPGIRTIFEAGERDRQLFYNVLEWIDGPTLDEVGNETLVPVELALSLVEQLARAVEYAHQRRILHRHLEPAKVVLQALDASTSIKRVDLRQVQPRLLGFGLPRRPSEGETIDAELFISPGFLSPEQTWGRVRDLGPATDVYGLGSILYFLLTGKPPFRGPNLGETIDAIQTAPLVPPSAFRRLSLDVSFVCLKALARLPQQRYSSAGELADDLHRVARHRSPLQGPSQLQARVGRWLRRVTLARLFVGAAVVLLAVWLGYLMGVRATSPSADLLVVTRSERDQARRELASLRSVVDDIEQQQRFQNYRQKLKRVVEVLDRGIRPNALALLESCSLEERGIEWHYLHRRATGLEPLHHRVSKKGEQTFVSFLPGSTSRLAVLHQQAWSNEYQARLELLDGSNGTQLVSQLSLQLPLGRIHGVAFAPDGRRFVVCTRELTFYSLQPGPQFGQVQRRIPLQSGLGARLAWSPLGGTLAIAEKKHAVCLHQVGSSTLVDRPISMLAPSFELPLLEFSMDGQLLGIAPAGDSVVHLVELIPRIQIRTVLRGPGVIHCFAFAPNNEIAVARSDESIRFYDTQSGQEQGVLENLPKTIRKLAYNCTGTRLAVGLEGGSVQLYGKAGRTWQELLSMPGEATIGLCFNASDRALLTANAEQTLVFGSLLK